MNPFLVKGQRTNCKLAEQQKYDSQLWCLKICYKLIYNKQMHVSYRFLKNILFLI